MQEFLLIAAGPGYVGAYIQQLKADLLLASEQVCATVSSGYIKPWVRHLLLASEQTFATVLIKPWVHYDLQTAAESTPALAV